MSQRINVLILCDLDEAEPASATMITVDGSSVELDLCEAHRKELDESLEAYFQVGRRSGRRRKPGAPASTGTGTETLTREERSQIRTWAQEQGYEMGERGRVAANIVEAYRAAH